MLFTNIRPIAFALALALPILALSTVAHAEPNAGPGKHGSNGPYNNGGATRSPLVGPNGYHPTAAALSAIVAQARSYGVQH